MNAGNEQEQTLSLSDVDGFVSIAEAARRLGISERQARRDARRLPDSDRRDAGQTPDRAGHRAPVRVRLAALAALRGQSVTPDTSAAGAGHEPDTGAGRSPDGRDELIEQLRGEVGRTNAALERSQNALSQALDVIATTQQRVTMLELQAGRLIEALPGSLTQGGQGPDTSRTADDTPSGPEGAQAGAGEAPGATAAPRSWLGRLLRREREEA